MGLRKQEHRCKPLRSMPKSVASKRRSPQSKSCSTTPTPRLPRLHGRERKKPNSRPTGAACFFSRNRRSEETTPALDEGALHNGTARWEISHGFRALNGLKHKDSDLCGSESVKSV